MLSMLSAFTALPPAFDCVEAGVRGLSVLLTHPVISIVRELVTLRRGGFSLPPQSGGITFGSQYPPTPPTILISGFPMIVEVFGSEGRVSSSGGAKEGSKSASSRLSEEHFPSHLGNDRGCLSERSIVKNMSGSRHSKTFQTP